MNTTLRQAHSRAMLAAALALASLLGTGAATAIELKAATQTAQGNDQALLLDKFKELVESRSGGEIKVSIYYNSTLGTQQQMQEQVMLGTTEVITSASNIVDMEPKFGIFDFPFLFKDREHVYRVLDGEVGRTLADALLAARGVRVLGYGELGFRQVTNNVRPITSAADLKGLKIRVPNNKFRIAAFEALGTAPTPIDYKELYGALQQGVVDGQENPLTAFKEKSMWEVQKYISLTNHVFTPATLLVNERWFQKLDPRHQAILQEAGAEAARWEREQVKQMEVGLLEDFKAKGVQVDTPDTSGFVDLTRPTWKEFEATVGADLVAKVLELR